MRGSTEEALTAIRTTVLRGVIVKTDDSRKMQEVEVRLFNGQLIRSVERMQTSGHTSVAPPMGQDGKGAEIVVVAPTGDLSQAIVVAVDDRRHRPKNLKPGEDARYDDQGQVLKIAREGYEATAKKLTLTAGDKPDTTGFELNEQLKGLAARLAQAEHNLHGLHNVTSRFREIVQTVIPAVVAVAPELNKLPSGLETMASAIAGGQAEAYLQKAVEQGLQKFLSPNLAGLESVLSGGIEATINSLGGQIAELIASNPVIKKVDELRAELDALTTSGGAPQVIQAGIARLQPQIAAMLAGNPVIATVDGLRGQLASAIASAGPGLNFLAPQKRLVQGLTRSMRLGG